MNDSQYYNVLANKLPVSSHADFIKQLEAKCEILILEKNEALIAYQSNNRKIYFIVR